MKTSTKDSRRHPRKRSRHEAGVAAGCAIFLVASGTAAMAQEQPGDEEIGEVVVTGIRKSIQDSIAAKKDNSSIIEVISAEDIGKLPDASIAEAIARLPGIAAQRTNGRAQTLSIRGLGPDFTVTTFNGREQASTNDNRTVEFDQYPSELVNQVKVFKTPDAGMVYQGIAGTTDIETVHPLAYDDRKFAVGYKREMDGQSANIPGLPDAGDRANFTYIDQFMDHKLGVAFGVAYNKTPYQAQTREPWGYADAGGGNTVIGGDKDGVKSAFYARTAYMGVAEFAPTDDLRMVLDAYHSNFHELQTVQRLEYGTVWAGATLTNPGPVVNDRVTSGDFADIPFSVVENYNNDNHAKVDSIGLNTDYKINDDWGLNADLSWSKVKRNNLRLESTAGTGSGADPTFAPDHESVTFTTQGDGRTNLTPSLNYSSYDEVFLTDPGGWGGGPRRSGFVGYPDISDEIKAIRLSASRKLEGFFGDITFGANYADRTKDKQNSQSVLWLTGNISHAPVPEDFRTGVANTDFFGSPTGMISYDALALYRSGFWSPIDAKDDPNAALGDRQSDITNTWTVDEKLTTAYVKLGIDSELGSLPLKGNIGVQAVHTDQTSHIGYSSGYIGSTTDLNQSVQEIGTTYTDILPSLNLALELAHEQKVRFGAAITEARPRMDDLAGGSTYTAVSDNGAPVNVDGTLYYWSRTGGGNPELKPWKANTFDVSWEKYWNNQGYVSFAVYYKDLTRYIFNQSSIVSFEGVLLPDQRSASDPTAYTLADENRDGVGTVKVNGNGGYIQGAEFTASIPLSMFTKALDGFGFIVSAAKNSSSIKINGVDTDVPGLSKTVLNSTLYYEKYGFSVRVSNRYRGDFLGEVPQFDSTLTFRTVHKESLVDAQIGYTFDQGSMKGLSINLSGTNLTDEPFILSNAGDPAYDLVQYEKYGAVYALALSYTF